MAGSREGEIGGGGEGGGTFLSKEAKHWGSRKEESLTTEGKRKKGGKTIIFGSLGVVQGKKWRGKKTSG